MTTNAHLNIKEGQPTGDLIPITLFIPVPVYRRLSSVGRILGMTPVALIAKALSNVVGAITKQDQAGEDNGIPK